MHILALLAFIGYWIFLTALLLVRNPAALIGLHKIPYFPWGDFGIHLIAFTGLGFLANAARWPKRPGWLMIAVIVVYGIATELLQPLFPPRTLEVMDGIEDILGIAAGSLIYWLMLWLLQRYLRSNAATGLVRCEENATGE
jgi:hypothetical protein